MVPFKSVQGPTQYGITVLTAACGFACSPAQASNAPGAAASNSASQASGALSGPARGAAASSDASPIAAAETVASSTPSANASSSGTTAAGSSTSASPVTPPSSSPPGSQSAISSSQPPAAPSPSSSQPPLADPRLAKPQQPAAARCRSASGSSVAGRGCWLEEKDLIVSVSGGLTFTSFHVVETVAPRISAAIGPGFNSTSIRVAGEVGWSSVGLKRTACPQCDRLNVVDLSLKGHLNVLPIGSDLRAGLYLGVGALLPGGWREANGDYHPSELRFAANGGLWLWGPVGTPPKTGGLQRGNYLERLVVGYEVSCMKGPPAEHCPQLATAIQHVLRGEGGCSAPDLGESVGPLQPPALDALRTYAICLQHQVSDSLNTGQSAWGFRFGFQYSPGGALGEWAFPLAFEGAL
jgi:hypothetical protein